MKKLLAIILPLVALGFVLMSVARVRPPLEQEKPLANKFEEQQLQAVEEKFEREMRTFLSSLENRVQFEEWLAKDASKMATEEKREHQRQLKELLTEDQISTFRWIKEEKREDRAAVQAMRKRRMINMVGGEKEWERNQEDMRRVREQKAARKAAQQESVE